MKKYLVVFMTLVLTVSLSACGNTSTQSGISDILGIDVSAGVVISDEDDHGGFHGDGTTCVVIEFSDDGIENQFAENEDWKMFPMSETVAALVYGVTDGTSSLGPYLTDDDGNTLIPEIQNGYYMLIDRQADDGLATGADILHRSSFNFTLGIYDADTHTLYYCEMDT